MPGFHAIYDEESSRVEPADDGVPFRIAVLAAIEEVVGVSGDIEEGDCSGRVAESPTIKDDLEKQRDYLEKLTERKAGGKTTRLNAVKKQVLDALVAEGDTFGYIDLLDHHKGFCAEVQKFLEGPGGITLDSLCEYARDARMDDFLKAMGQPPAPARKLGMGA